MKKVLIATLTLIWASAAFAGEKAPKYAVSELEAQGGVEKNVAALLSTEVCNKLYEIRKAEVVCPSDLKALAQVQGQVLALGGCKDGNCTKNLAKLAKADRVITGSVGKVGEAFLLQLALTDAKNGKILARVSENAEGDASELLNRIGPAVTKLTAKKKR